MRHRTLLTAASLLSILLMTLHLTDDTLFANNGMGARGPANVATVLILLAWTVGTLLLSRRRTGQLLMLLGALLGAAMPVIHMTGTGGIVGASLAGTTRAFFFVWVTMLVGVTSSLSAILAAWTLMRPRDDAASQGA